MVTCSDDIFLCGGDIYIMDVTERHFLAKPRRRKDTEVSFCGLFLFRFFSTVILTRVEMVHTIGHPTNYILAPPPCRKPCAMITWSTFRIHLTGK